MAKFDELLDQVTEVVNLALALQSHREHLGGAGATQQ